MQVRKLALIAAFLIASAVRAGTVAVRFREGVVHGFLSMSTQDGRPVADGDLLQTCEEGDLVRSRLVYRFRDGSIQEERTEFLQRKVFSLVHYELVQKGPTFPDPQEVAIDGKTGEVTVRSVDGNGKQKVRTTKLELPDDLANGMLAVILKNLSSGTTSVELSMLVATPKPRLVKLEIARAENDPLYLGSSKRAATRFVIKVKIGGLAGVFASILGKVPPDSSIWILYEETPAFVRSESPLFEGSPLMRTVLISPRWTETMESPARK